MSIEEYKNIVRRYQEICNSNDLDALGKVVAEDVLTPRIMPGMPDWPTGIDDLIAESDKAAARIAEGKIVEHWGEEDGISLMQQLGVLKM